MIDQLTYDNIITQAYIRPQGEYTPLANKIALVLESREYEKEFESTINEMIEGYKAFSEEEHRAMYGNIIGSKITDKSFDQFHDKDYLVRVFKKRRHFQSILVFQLFKMIKLFMQYTAFELESEYRQKNNISSTSIVEDSGKYINIKKKYKDTRMMLGDVPGSFYALLDKIKTYMRGCATYVVTKDGVLIAFPLSFYMDYKELWKNDVFKVVVDYVQEHPNYIHYLFEYPDKIPVKIFMDSLQTDVINKCYSRNISCFYVQFIED